MSDTSYFARTGEHTWRATHHTSGAWRTDEQHIAPALGLLTHLVETDRVVRRGDDLVVSRLSFDILGTVPVAEVETSVRVLRPGRTIELVEATMSHGGRVALVLRAWLLQPGDTSTCVGSALPAIPGPDETPAWDPTSVWPGGFIASVQVRRAQVEPGRARFWVRTDVPLVEDEPVGDLARFVGLLDISNGMTVRADPRELLFPNVDLTAHLFRQPRGPWVGFDTTVSFGPGAVGLTSSVLHDEHGPVGTSAQSLTLRPAPAS
jgi:hypothetical protein